MSRHYVAQRQPCFGGQVANVDEIIRQLGRTRPELAQRLAGVDWTAIVAKVARDTLAAVAAARRIHVADHFERPPDFHTGAWQPPSGECVGVLQLSGNRQIGLIRNGTAFTVHAVFPQDTGEGDTRQVRQELERAYRERAVAAALEILAESTPERQTLDDGTVVIEATIRGGGR